MQRRAAAISVALALLLAVPAALAGKPTRTLPHQSASRGIGPESLSRAARRQAQHAGLRPAKRGRSRAVAAAPSSAKARVKSSGRRQRSDAAHVENRRTKTREVAIHETRRSKRSRTPDREERRASREANAIADLPRRLMPRTTESRFSPEPLRAPAQQGKSQDQSDTDASPATPQEAFGSISPLKSIEQEAGTPVLLPNLRVASLYDSRGRLVVPQPLYGSHEILLHQNQMADKDGLERVRDEAGLDELLRQRKLVALPASDMLLVDDRLPGNRRYSRPWTAAFLAVLSRDYYANFHQPLFITSAVRTVEVQRRLVRTNGNAAPSSGEDASPHLTGQAVDIAKHGLNMTQIAWMRTYLQPLIGDGKIDVEEEFRQACFHISVYRSYVPTVPRLSVAAARPTEIHP